MLSNRSAAYAAITNFARARSDAVQVHYTSAPATVHICWTKYQAIKLSPEWEKGYYRKGYAEEGLLLLNEALAAYRKGQSACGGSAMLQENEARLAGTIASLNLSPPKENKPTNAKNPDKDRFQVGLHDHPPICTDIRHLS